MEKKKQALTVLRRLKKEYPEARTALGFVSPFELLVATVLSAQTTDNLVNKVTLPLFRKYPSVGAFAKASQEDLEVDIRSVNFYRTKARNIIGAAKRVLQNYGGEMPRTMEDLISLPGVARKTANIILYNAFGINEGIAVDTHVKRLANRLGLSGEDDPEKIERDLIALVPRKDWGILTHLLIEHGRSVCQARKPRHEVCVLLDICPSRDI